MDLDYKWSEYFLSLFDEATETAHQAFRALPAALHAHREPNFFGPSDIPCHLIQSEALAINFIMADLGHGSLILPGELLDILAIENDEDRHRALSKANFKGARGLSEKFGSYDASVAKWAEKRSQARAALAKLSHTELHHHVSHPLVTLEGPLFVVGMTMFVRHLDYHVGQFTDAVKHGKHIDAVQFPFGKMQKPVQIVEIQRA